MNYSYRLPNEQKFVSTIVFNYPQLERLITKISFEFSDEGNAYYFDHKPHGWNRNALRVIVKGDFQTLTALKEYNNNNALKNIFQSAVSTRSGFDVVHVIFSPVEKGLFQKIPTEIENKIKIISVRNAEFDNMTLNERLSELNKLLENLLTKDNKYFEVDYDQIFFERFNGESIKQYRKDTHIFRHASEEAVTRVKSMSDKEKAFLVDLGMFYSIHIYNTLYELG